jgi:hypothetical protein
VRSDPNFKFRDAIRAIFDEVFPDALVDDECSVASLGGDSLDAVSIMSAIILDLCPAGDITIMIEDLSVEGLVQYVVEHAL